MQSNLVAQLCQTSTFSTKLISILDNIRKSINNRWNKSSIKQVEHHLISLTCQNKNLLHYKYLQEKSNNQRCLANIIEILIITAKISKQSRENITYLFLSHVLSHTSCYVSYYTFYVVLEAVPDLLNEITHESLLEINNKLKRQQNGENFKILESIQIQQSEVFTPENIQLCQKNLDNYLWNQIQPNLHLREKEKTQKTTQTKIPPLIIPTSKSINSSRYSAISRDEKRKGLADFQKLASNLGQNFIAVELGCLLSNKRTRQVQQFSENQTYRQKCLQQLDQLETERLNSSRLTMHKGIVGDNQQIQENAKKYYRKVLTINLNIFLKKIPEKFKIMDWIHKKLSSHKKKTQSNLKQNQSVTLVHYAHQIIDMTLVGMINLAFDGKSKNSKKENNKMHEGHSDLFSKLIRNLKPISDVAKEIMCRISIQAEKLHINMLTNRNKEDANSHFGFDHKQFQINDQYLDQAKLKINELPRVDGIWKDHKKIMAIKKYSEPILLYLGSWLQSLQQLADMGHPMFYYYQTNILKTLAFYLSICENKISSYYFAQYIFRLFLMIKRSIIQLTHPYMSPRDPLRNQNMKTPLTHRNPQLISYFLTILASLLEGANKHLEKLIANIFIKNIYFMEVIQNYLQFVVKEENVQATVQALIFYKKAIEVYTASNRKQQHKLANQNSAIYFLFQHIADYLCPKNGCLAQVLIKYEGYISPANLQEYDEEEPRSTSQKSFSNASSGLLQLAKNSQNNIQRYLHEILLFISHIYYLATPLGNESLLVLQEDTCSFYIKYSIMHFIKLYSLLTVNELANINESNRRNELDYMLSTKESPHPLSKINTKQIFMIDFLKILTNISINRTPQIAKKFRQYRVLEFFVRQIELEFSVKQNIEKYIKKAVNIRDVNEVLTKNQQKQKQQEKSKKNQKIIDNNKESSKKQPQQKKVVVPSFNLTGEIFKKNSEQSKGKELNSTINQKVKKLVPSLNLPIKTQESHEGSKESKQKNKKNILDDMLDEIVSKNPKKKSFKEELNLKLDGLSFGNKDKSSIGKSRSPKQSCDSNMIYYTERKIRKIYSNKVLHAESIMLILSLILYKGQLDPLYCDQMPIIHGKLNVLYILHYHLNHERNKSVVSILAQSVSKIKPSLSGQRLFKLLSNQFTNLSHYHDWTKINAGAFGVILSAKTNLVEPKEVAIKQMNFPKSIYQRCALVDIFTQITSLEMFRLEEKVTKMYNYGVSDNTYIVIMKKYACSLRQWRLGNAECPQAKLFPPTLPNILALFYQVIKGLKLLHEQNVTHYDIKGDNILLQFIPSHDPKEPPKVNVVFADFGVSKIYEDEKDELDLKSRGTQCIKSPQMLTLTLKNKKQSDNYDRRKKIGTTKASDVWSLGCLLYEIVTGQYLFNSNDWVHFFMLVTSHNEQILSPQNCEKMKNNIYLIDFIKYILIRDPQHRPSIQSILCRFESLYSLLVSNPERTASSNLREINSKSLDNMVAQYYELIKKQQKNFGAQGFLQGSKRLKSEEEFGRTGKVMQFFNPKFSGKITKIMEDMYFCQRQNQVLQYESVIRQEGITHIIVEAKTKINKNKFKLIQIESNRNYSLSLVYRTSPRISDVLREVLLLKGKLLFVNSESNFCMNLLIFTLSYWFKCAAYETWCLINTQILQFPALTSSIVSLSRSVSMLLSIEQKMQDMPKLQCICGSVTIILKSKFQQKRGELKVCKCKRNRAQNTGCFSKNCPNYLQFIRRRYNIVWDHLTWTLIQNNQLLTPLFNQNSQQIIKTQIILNSANPLSNMPTDSKQSDEWKLYQCKTCDMWILATNGKQIWLILNNLIKFCRQGIMIPNAQQDFKSKTPALNYYTLSKLHMTSQ